MPASPAIVRVLEEDRALGAALAGRERAAAAQRLIAAEIRLPRGTWIPDLPLGARAGDLGYLVLDGLLVRVAEIGRHSCSELLGAGDLLRPWDVDEGEAVPISHEATWRVLDGARLAVLDARFAALAGRFPPLVASLLSRTVRRAQWLAMLLAVSAMPRLDARLLTVLWHLADRWGHVAHDGTVVPFPLTHETLAGLVGAKRPSVTTALRGLERDGLVRRDDDGGWVLLGEPPGDPEQAAARTGTVRP